MVVVHYFSQIDEGIPHASQCSIDAGIRMLRYFLETQSVEKAKFQNFLLVVRKVHYHSVQILVNLLCYQLVFYIITWFADDVKNGKILVFVGCFGDFVVLAFGSVVVYNKVVSNAFCPKNKLAFLRITPFFQGNDDFHKSILKDIVCQFLVLNFEKYKRKKVAFVAFY